MGIGCVLLLWGAVAAVFAIGAAIVLGFGVAQVRRRLPRLSRAWIFIAAGLPLFLLVYAGAAFIAYAVWCDQVRGVDPALGDSWWVPLPNGWRFSMVDVTDSGFIRSPDNGESCNEVTGIGVKGDYIFGRNASGFFAIDSRGRSGTCPPLSEADFTGCRAVAVVADSEGRAGADRVRERRCGGCDAEREDRGPRRDREGYDEVAQRPVISAPNVL